MDNSLENQIFHAHGKLLITAEYLVLHGAEALAIPLKFGQTLSIESTNNKWLTWSAFTPDGVWFDVKFDLKLNITETTNANLALTLQKILQIALKLANLSVMDILGSQVKTMLQFNKDWGFGSSSTLISLISQWLKINPYKLLEVTFGGSGYDIAVATNNKPIIYKLTDSLDPIVQQSTFNPKFASNIIFFYLQHKQTSSLEVIKFQKIKPDKAIITDINQLTRAFAESTTLPDFQEKMLAHEKIISQYINKPSINESMAIPSTTIKSLGAWGGDFAMAVSPNIETTKQILNEKGFTTHFSYNELIYNAS